MNSKELLDFDRAHIWHPYTSATNPLSVYLAQSAEGARIKLADGRELIDGMSSWWSVVHGYKNPKIDEAIKNQLSNFSHIMFGGLTHEPAIKLAKSLLEIVPNNLTRIFFCDSGSVAVEVAMKMALQYQRALGQVKRTKFASITKGYHGDTWHAMSVCDPVTGMHSVFSGALNVQIFADSPKSIFGGKYDEADTQNLRTKLEAHKDEIAALILEPIVQGAGAMRFYHPKFLSDAAKICKELNILLIADEIATGFGRTGKLFACEHANVKPDIMCLGKAITGGYLSFAATLCSERIATKISEGEGGVFMHGPTFMGNPLACAAANASLELVCAPEYLKNVLRIERTFKEILPKALSFKGVKNVRILGAIGVLELEKNLNLERIQKRFVERGIWVRPFGKLAYLMPPFVISDKDLETLCVNFLDAVEEEISNG